MIWITIITMAILVFCSRYIFLAPKLPITLNAEAEKFLSYASPAVLTSIWAPIVFLPNGELSLTWSNPYLIAAILAAITAWKSKSILLTAVLSMAVFFTLQYALKQV